MLTSSFRTASVSTLAFALLLVAVPASAQNTQSVVALRSAASIATLALPSPNAAVLAQTDDAVATLFSNPSHAASMTSRPERAASAFARFALAMTAALGSYQSHEVLGAEPAPRGRTYTYALVRFAEDTVSLRLTWNGATLVTATRGVAPGPATPLARN